MKIFIILLLSSSLFCQQLPDAPSVVQHDPAPAAKQTCGPSWLGGCWDYSRPTLSVKQTFKSPWFYGPTIAWVASDMLDVEMTHAYEGHPCVEGNEDLSKLPTRGELYRNIAETEGPLLVLGWIIVKVHRKPTDFIYTGMATYVVVKHTHAALQWPGCR